MVIVDPYSTRIHPGILMRFVGHWVVIASLPILSPVSWHVASRLACLQAWGKRIVPADGEENAAKANDPQVGIQVLKIRGLSLQYS